MDGYDADSSRSNSPHLPRISTGYDTPGSDYMSAVKSKQRQSSLKYRDREEDARLFAPSAVSSISKSQNNSAKCSRDGNRENGCSRRHGKQSKEKHGHTKGNRVYIPREITIPTTNRSIAETLPKKASTDLGLAGSLASPLKLSLAGSPTFTRFASPQSTPSSRKQPWIPPRVSTERYEEAKARIMDGGKFRSRLVTYFREDVPWWETKTDSEDDGYDTDLDKQLGRQSELYKDNLVFIYNYL